MEQKVDLVSPLKMFLTPIHRTFGWKSNSIPEATKVYDVAQADPDDINLEYIILHCCPHCQVTTARLCRLSV